MTPVLAKDVRFAMDGLRPWAVLAALATGLMFAFAFGRVLLESGPSFGLSRAITTLRELGLVLTIGACAAGAWVAASVVLGDRRHGAAALVRTLPVRPAVRVASRVAVIALGVLLVALPAGLVEWVRSALELMRASGVEGRVGGSLLVAVGAAGVGAGLAVGTAGMVASRTQAVALAILAAMVAGFLGAVAAGLALPLLGGGAYWSITQAQTVAGVRSDVQSFGGAAAIGAAALVCPVAAAIASLQARTRRWTAKAIMTGAAIVAAVGALSVPAGLATSQTMSDSYEAQRFRLSGLSDQELAERLGRIADRRANPTPAEREPSFPDYLTLDIVRERLVRLPRSERDRHPLALALRSLEDTSTADGILWTVQFLHFNDEPRRVPLLLDGLARFGTDRAFTFQAAWRLREAGIIVASDWPAPLDDEALRGGGPLQAALRHRIAEGHPESERMAAALAALAGGAVEAAPTSSTSSSTSSSDRPRP